MSSAAGADALTELGPAPWRLQAPPDAPVRSSGGLLCSESSASVSVLGCLSVLGFYCMGGDARGEGAETIPEVFCSAKISLNPS